MKRNQRRREIVRGASRPQADSRLFLVMAPAALGRLVGAIESLATLRDFGIGQILQGRSQYRSQSLLPMAVRRRLDSSTGAVLIQVATIAGSGLVLLGRGRRSQQIAGSAVLFATKWLSETRTPYGGDGADQMSDVISGYRLLTAVISNHEMSDDLFLRSVNAQLSVCYLASGLAKLIGTTWQSGDALGLVLRTRQYGASRLAAMLRRAPRMAKALTWFTILWETTFPIVYALPPRLARFALHGVKGFHLGVAIIMALPRFFWSFSSAHAAAAYVIERRAR